MADSSMYDEMDLETEEEPVEAEEAETEGLDAQFEMHAKDAGMKTPEQIEAFKAAIERCVTLREESMYAKDVASEELDLEGDDTEI